MRLISIFIFLCLALSASAQSDITTLILVRHAEKVDDGTKDPALSAEGKERAAKLSKALSNQKIDAIYSTNYARTKGTVSPLASALKLDLTLYDKVTRDNLQKIISANRGGTVLICGHSNTVPLMVNMLAEEELLKQFDESDYENLIIVSVSGSGTVKLTQLKY